MDEAETKRIAEGLKKAMEAEQEGCHFYRMAAQSTQDPKGKKVFEELAEEEFNHFTFLKKQLESVVKTGTVDRVAKLGERKVFSGTHPIFSEEIKDRIGIAHYEMTALSIGVQLEQSAVKFYSAEAEAAKDTAIKAFYQDLSEWERGHMEMLQAQADALRADYWDQGGFSPF